MVDHMIDIFKLYKPTIYTVHLGLDYLLTISAAIE